MMEEKKERVKKRFTPPKKKKALDYHISDHAVQKYVERIGHNGGNIRGAIKGVMENGETVKSAEKGCVIHRDGVYLIIREGQVKTVYNKKVYSERKEKIYIE